MSVFYFMPTPTDQLLTDARKLYRNLPKHPAAWSNWEWTKFIAIATELARRGIA